MIGLRRCEIFIYDRILLSHKYIYIYIYIYRERERERENGAREYYAQWYKSEKDKYYMTLFICII